MKKKLFIQIFVLLILVCGGLQAGCLKINAQTSPDLKIDNYSMSPNNVDLSVKDLTIYFTNVDAAYFQQFRIKLYDKLTNYTDYKTVTSSAQSNVDFSLKPGTYELEITIDSDNVIAESNEANNIISPMVKIMLDVAIIDAVVSDLSSTTVKITWTTNIPSDTWIFYDQNRTYEITYENTSQKAVISHQVILNDLLPGTKYYYKVSSRDEVNENSLKAEKIGEFITAAEVITLSYVEQEKAYVTNPDYALTRRLYGYILLQTEMAGQAWYVDPVSGLKYYLPDGPSAYAALRKFGLGITSSDLSKIPVGIESRFQETDTDGDGLGDKLEEGLGTNLSNQDTDGDGYFDLNEIQTGNNPLASGITHYDYNLANRLKGRILLQVQSRGEAWYVNPKDGKRYYMKDGEAAYQIMRFLSLGITNSDLRQIPVGIL